MKHSIFLKSHESDRTWLSYALRSINKFASGFSEVVIALPEGMSFQPQFGEHIIYIRGETAENGYRFQQCSKLYADALTEADSITFVDSDCIFTRPVTPETFMRDGKIMWLMTPMDKAREDQRTAWIPVMTKWMNKVPEYEFMHRHPFMFPRWFFEKIRGFCANQHGVTLDDYIMSQPGRSFSEFNNAGFLAYEHFRDRFEWINTETDHMPPGTVLQHWSPGGLTEEIKAELEAILKTENASDSTANSAIVDWVKFERDAKSADQPTNDSREAIVRDAVAVLRQLCTAPRYISQVRKELKAQGVIRR